MRLHELGVVGRRKLDSYALDYVERQTGHERDGDHFPRERTRLDEISVYEIIQN